MKDYLQQEIEVTRRMEELSVTLVSGDCDGGGDLPKDYAYHVGHDGV